MHITLVLVASLVLAGTLAAQPEFPYKVVEGWPQLPAACEPGAGMAVSIDQDGRVIQAWKEDPKRSNHATAAHGMTIGPDGGISLVDRETNTIWKYSPAGRTLLTIGSFSARQGDNNSRYAFHRPAGVAHDSHGNAHIADGYGNTRIAKYGPGGDYITHWGGKGTADGQFNLVHDAMTDPNDRIYIADRGNNRIQVFDADGKFLTKWEGIGTPWGLAYDPREQFLWMCDGDLGRVLKLSPEGKVLGAFGSDGKAPGQLHQVHSVAVDGEGSIYVAETRNTRIQKFVRAASSR